jgi:NADH-quinone oxidoreductase subunit J
MLQVMFFYLVALIAVISGFLVVTCKSPVNSALALVNTFFCLAVFYVMLHAPFMAAIQIMVYAGAIMVLILFVIMLLNLGVEPLKKYTHTVWGIIAGSLVFILTFLFITPQGQTSKMVGAITNEAVMREGHTELIGKAIFVDFLLPFELASILLLVAIVGAVILAKREV